MWKDKTGEHAVGLQFWDTKKADSFGDAFESALKLSLSMSVKIDHSQKLTSSQPREAVGEEMKNKSSPLPAQSVATMALLLLQTKKNFV